MVGSDRGDTVSIAKRNETERSSSRSLQVGPARSAACAGERAVRRVGFRGRRNRRDRLLGMGNGLAAPAAEEHQELPVEPVARVLDVDATRRGGKVTGKCPRARVPRARAHGG